MLFLDIHSKAPYPSCALSNFADHPFVLDGVQIRCMEGLLQSLKVPAECQQELCASEARTAKQIGSSFQWQKNGALFHWNGRYFSRYSKDYRDFLNRAYDALTDQSPDFAAALRETGHCVLWHSIGRFSRKQTCLTTWEFVRQLYRVRRRVRKRA